MIVTPPFFAVQVFPGPIGTSVGLMTDINARVVKSDGEVIKGLYASGNDMSSIMRVEMNSAMQNILETK